MTIAASVQKFLSNRGVHFDLVEHTRTTDSTHSAEAAHVPGDNLAKGTVLKDEQGFMVAVVPATRQVNLGELHRRLDRKLGLATEAEVEKLFRDCEPGAVPPLGEAYGVDSILDDSLLEAGEIYFEAGDHLRLVHISGKDFRKLMADIPHADISWRAARNS